MWKEKFIQKEQCYSRFGGDALQRGCDCSAMQRLKTNEKRRLQRLFHLNASNAVFKIRRFITGMIACFQVKIFRTFFSGYL